MKRFFAILLLVCMSFSLAACSQEPEREKEDLSKLSDEKIVERLLSDYRKAKYPVVQYEGSVFVTVAQTTLEMRYEASVNGTDLSYKAFAEEETQPVLSVVCVNGTAYLDMMGVKTKTADTDLVASYAELPFVLEDLDVFAKKDLLRTENDAYVLVLSEPSDAFIGQYGLEDMIESQLPSEDGEDDSEAPIEIRSLEGTFVSIVFSTAGEVQQLTVGVSARVLYDGEEMDLSMEAVYDILSRDAASVVVTAPSDASEYEDLSSEDTDADSDASSDSSSDRDTTDGN